MPLRVCIGLFAVCVLGQFLYAFIHFKWWHIFHSHLFKLLLLEKVNVYRKLYTNFRFMPHDVHVKNKTKQNESVSKWVSQSHLDEVVQTVKELEINTKGKETANLLWFMAVPWFPVGLQNFWSNVTWWKLWLLEI